MEPRQFLSHALEFAHEQGLVFDICDPTARYIEQYTLPLIRGSRIIGCIRMDGKGGLYYEESSGNMNSAL